MVFAGCLNFLWALLVFVAFWEHIGIEFLLLYDELFYSLSSDPSPMRLAQEILLLM